jgi:hypothetical protein
METNTIINQAGRKLTFILYHEEVCVKGGRCFCQGGRPDSLHIPSGTAAKDVPESVMLSSDAKRALSLKEIKVLPTPKVKQTKKSDEKVTKKKGKDKGHRRGKKD